MEQRNRSQFVDARQLGTVKMLIPWFAAYVSLVFSATYYWTILVFRIFSEGLWGAACQRFFLYRLHYFVQALARLYFICVQSLREITGFFRYVILRF